MEVRQRIGYKGSPDVLRTKQREARKRWPLGHVQFSAYRSLSLNPTGSRSRVDLWDQQGVHVAGPVIVHIPLLLTKSWCAQFRTGWMQKQDSSEPSFLVVFVTWEAGNLAWHSGFTFFKSWQQLHHNFSSIGLTNKAKERSCALHTDSRFNNNVTENKKAISNNSKALEKTFS